MAELACGVADAARGLLALSVFIAALAALAALVHQLVILAAVTFGGWIAVRVFGPQRAEGGNVFHR